MRAAVFHGPRDVRIENVPDPVAPAPDEVVLEVIRAAICGTDASEWDHGPVLCRPGVVLGHEFVGRVVDVGDGRHRPARRRPGRLGRRDLVRSLRLVLRGRTNLCAEYRTLGLQVDGGLAEYVTSPAAICHAVPGRVRRRRGSDDAAARRRAPRPLPRRAGAGRAVAVIGAGGIGSFIVAGASRRAATGASSRSTSTTSGSPTAARSARARRRTPRGTTSPSCCSS